MARTNYTYEKRQKELAKQKKQADKLLKKAAQKEERTENEDQTQPSGDDNSKTE